MTSPLSLSFGARSLLPDEAIVGYGYHPLLTNTIDNRLIRAGRPLSAHASLPYGIPWICHLEIHASLQAQHRRCYIWQEAYESIVSGLGRSFQLPPVTNGAYLFRWRSFETGGEWIEVPGQFLQVTLSSVDQSGAGDVVLTEGVRWVVGLDIEDRRLDPSSPDYDIDAPVLPGSVSDEVEFFLMGPVAPSEHHPVLIEGMSAGQFLKNVYDGIYSPVDPATGDVIPTGIRYAEAALLAITTPVRMRLNEPIEDARSWLEEHIYAPLGLVPALDQQGRVSPVSQIPPSTTEGLPVLNNAVTEASPEWSAGERIATVVRFRYPRDYVLGPPDPVTTQGQDRQNVLDAQEIVLEFEDPVGTVRNGRQEIEISGEAFRAIGKVVDDDEVPPTPGTLRPRFHRRPRDPVTAQPVVRGAVPVIPVTADIEDEIGWQLGQDRGRYLLARYALGAPTARLTVRRDLLPTLRAGSWVLLDLSWFPDYVTNRRGLLALGQIVAIYDLDCTWRRVTVEVIPPDTGS